MAPFRSNFQVCLLLMDLCEPTVAEFAGCSGTSHSRIAQIPNRLSCGRALQAVHRGYAARMTIEKLFASITGIDADHALRENPESAKAAAIAAMDENDQSARGIRPWHVLSVQEAMCGGCSALHRWTPLFPPTKPSSPTDFGSHTAHRAPPRVRRDPGRAAPAAKSQPSRPSAPDQVRAAGVPPLRPLPLRCDQVLQLAPDSDRTGVTLQQDRL